MRVNMRITTDPATLLPVFSEDLYLVILARDGTIPEVSVAEGTPTPDRHLLLGLAQSAVLAIEERDPETVVCKEYRSILLHRSGETKELVHGLVIGTSRDRSFGVLASCDWKEAIHVARKTLRWFTGTVRLDIP
jgi:hypothetical protein